MLSVCTHLNAFDAIMVRSVSQHDCDDNNGWLPGANPTTVNIPTCTVHMNC